MLFYEDPGLTTFYTGSKPRFTLRAQPGNIFICSNTILGPLNSACYFTTISKPGLYNFVLDIKYNFLNANNITVRAYSNTTYSPIVINIQPINPNDNVNAVITVYQDKNLRIPYNKIDFIINEAQLGYYENAIVTQKAVLGVGYMGNLPVKGLGDITLLFTSDFLFPSLSFLKVKAYLNIEPVGEYVKFI